MAEWSKAAVLKTAPETEIDAVSAAKVADRERDPERSADDKCAIAGRSGETSGETIDVVEAALADALTKASAAGRWATVEVLARELAARREARGASNVVLFDAKHRRR